MAERTELLSADDPAWDRWVDRAPNDFHHGAAYHGFCERMGEGRARLVVHGTEERFIAWPYLVRPIEGHPERADASSVYGYTGPIGSGLSDPGLRDRAWAAFRGAWAEQGLVTLFTRFHPLLANHLACAGLRGAAEVPGGELLVPGRTVSIDLVPDREARHAAYPKALRQELRSSARKGLSVELDRGWTGFEAFAELYRSTMAKNRASERYLFSDDYLEGLRGALGRDGHLAVARAEGEVAAALLFTVHGPIAQAHLTGVSTLFRRLSPLKGLIDGTADLARELGAEVLHLGAGRGGAEDSLFEFKRKFASSLHDFVLGRWILDAEAYAELSAGVEHAGDFFPAYRAPGVAAGGRR